MSDTVDTRPGEPAASIESSPSVKPGPHENRKARYGQPTMTTIGSARALTHGGFYNDWDSDGVRKTK